VVVEAAIDAAAIGAAAIGAAAICVAGCDVTTAGGEGLAGLVPSEPECSFLGGEGLLLLLLLLLLLVSSLDVRVS
jgi:hypothetical protein